MTQEDSQNAKAQACSSGTAHARAEASSLPTRSCVPYADPSYWDVRYSKQPLMFDWFYGWTALRRIIRAHMPRNKQLLQVGCGNSALQEGMAQAGYMLTNVDISPVVVEQMRAQHAAIPALQYMIGDARDMTDMFHACTFWGALEKGTIDALLCCKEGTDNVVRMCSEISRVLRPGCVFLTITLGEPAQRLPLLCRPQYDWTVSVLLLPRLPQDKMVQVPGRALPMNDTLKPVPAIGPLKVAEDLSVEGLPQPWDPSNYFYAYACRKTPLVLQADSKVQGAVPESWRTAAQQSLAKLQAEMGLQPDLFKRGMRKRTMRMGDFIAQQQARQQAGDNQQVHPSHSAGQLYALTCMSGHMHFAASQSGASTTEDSTNNSANSIGGMRRSMSADNNCFMQHRNGSCQVVTGQQQQQQQSKQAASVRGSGGSVCAEGSCSTARCSAQIDAQAPSTHSPAPYAHADESSDASEGLVRQLAGVHLTQDVQCATAQQTQLLQETTPAGSSQQVV